jgi:hypothetical protein
MDDQIYQTKKNVAYTLYTAQPVIHSPFFNEDVLLGSDGFRHLCVSAHGDRVKEEQIRRFILLPLALHILKTTTTVQTYRTQMVAVRTPGSPTWTPDRKVVQWWGFVALYMKQDIKVRVIVRKVGDDKPHFWSVMLP